MRGETAVTARSDKRKGKQRKVKKRKRTLAEKADRHELYEESVQCPEEDVKFFGRVFEEIRRRPPILLREDFCGTGNLAVTWCRSRPERRAIGIDLDQRTIAWGHERHVVPNERELGDRYTVYNANVLDPREERADITCACNFSFCVFKKRADLKQYLTTAREGLADDGLLFLEIYGGTEACAVMKEERDCEKWDYVWDQRRFNPLTAEALCHIHFEFPDGSTLKKAFTYDWRLWTIPELTELLEEVGFSGVRIYWEKLEDEDEDDDADMVYGSGEYVDVTGRKAEQQESFLVYVVGVK
jgi:SAM-dependent methyltransferase